MKEARQEAAQPAQRRQRPDRHTGSARRLRRPLRAARRRGGRHRLHRGCGRGIHRYNAISRSVREVKTGGSDSAWTNRTFYWTVYGRALARLRGRHDDAVRALRCADVSPERQMRTVTAGRRGRDQRGGIVSSINSRGISAVLARYGTPLGLGESSPDRVRSGEVPRTLRPQSAAPSICVGSLQAAVSQASICRSRWTRRGAVAGSSIRSRIRSAAHCSTPAFRISSIRPTSCQSL